MQQQHDITLDWSHLKPLEQTLENAGVIHIPAFPSLDGYVCYYPFPEGYKQLKIAHSLNGATDIMIKEIEGSHDQQIKAISAVPFPIAEWETGEFDPASISVDQTYIALYEKELKNKIGDEPYNNIISLVNQQCGQSQSLSSLLHFYEVKTKKIGENLPSFLNDRYHISTEYEQQSLSREESYYTLLFLFGGYAYHLSNDLAVLGYHLINLDFDNNTISLSLQEKRSEITIQWAKDYTNALLIEKQNSGYTKAMNGATRFYEFCKAHPYIGDLPSLGGKLDHLAETLIASCRLGLLKEGITQRNWEPKKIVEQWKKASIEIPLTMQDSILIGSPMETLYSFIVNTIAWIEAKGQYDESHELIFSYLNYYEIRLQNTTTKDKELSTTLATSLYKYLKKNDKVEDSQFPAIQQLAKSTRIPFKQLVQVYKPNLRVTDGVKGFYHFIARGNGNRMMATSISLSLLLMLMIYFIF